MRAELAPGIAVRRDRGAAGRVVPVQAQREALAVEKPAQKPAVGLGVELAHEFGPGSRQVKAGSPLERMAIVRLLPVLARFADHGFEERAVGKGALQRVEAVGGQQPGRVDPRVGTAAAKRGRVDCRELFEIEIPHDASAAAACGRSSTSRYCSAMRSAAKSAARRRWAALSGGWSSARSSAAAIATSSPTGTSSP